ncbi:hypothetical protein GCM10009776_37460 [Microbacterium deminutum]|uniref:PD-(D/E)XK nuclease superfamily protein n=1 Tax=Microbacterium deminutum TaxID=344164 RepID=A0ABP5CY86_9MICO
MAARHLPQVCTAGIRIAADLIDTLWRVVSVRAVSLDLSFLKVRLGSTPAPLRPVNVYDILRDGWRENRVDMTLQFFLDPNERHGLGSLVIDALLTALDGAPTIGSGGRTGTAFVAEQYLGSDAWEVSTQADFIDVYAANKEFGLAVVLENKIGHELNNPLDRYAASALADEDISTVLVAVLAPERRTPRGAQEAWLSRAITYSELAGEIKRSPGLIEHLLSPLDQDQRRGLDLLQQFIEARSGGTDMTDIAVEAARINEWRALLDENQDEIKQFLDARSRAARTIRDRNKRLAPLIAVGFDEAGLEVGWEAHGGYDTDVWNAYYFPVADWSIELKLSTNPAQPSIFVYDYVGRTYTDATVEPLGLEWGVPDQEVAEAFVDRVRRVLARRASTNDARGPQLPEAGGALSPG